MNKRIAVFGGSFDPPHNGHLHLVVSLIEKHHIDEVYVIPCGQSPLKKEVASAADRMEMTKRAFKDLPSCRVLSIEVDRHTVSYTIDTLEWLLRHQPEFRQAERFLFFGADVVPSFFLWKDLSRVFDIASPLIASRDRQEKDIPEDIRQTLSQGWTQTGLLDISSTCIRERVRSGLYVAHLLPSSVFEYVREHRLYMK